LIIFTPLAFPLGLYSGFFASFFIAKLTFFSKSLLKSSSGLFLGLGFFGLYPLGLYFGFFLHLPFLYPIYL
jgi:hypothetical protein